VVSFGRKSRTSCGPAPTSAFVSAHEESAKAAVREYDVPGAQPPQTDTTLRFGGRPGTDMGAPRKGTSLFKNYTTVQTQDLDAVEEHEIQDHEAQTSYAYLAAARAGLVNPDGGFRVGRFLVGALIGSMVLCLMLLSSSRSANVVSRAPAPPAIASSTIASLTASPPPPPVRYLANRGFTCKLDDSVSNTLTEASIPPARTTRGGEPCWSESQALSLARATQQCTFVTEEDDDDQGRRCVIAMSFCVEPISGVAEADESSNLVTCRYLHLPGLHTAEELGARGPPLAAAGR